MCNCNSEIDSSQSGNSINIKPISITTKFFTIKCDPLVITAIFPPLFPLYMIFILEPWGYSFFSSLFTWLISIGYHYSKEKSYNTIEPVLVHFNFVFLLIYLYEDMQWSFLSWLCLCFMLVLYKKGSGRGARENKLRTINYVFYHSLFHILASLFFITILWKSNFFILVRNSQRG